MTRTRPFPIDLGLLAMTVALAACARVAPAATTETPHSAGVQVTAGVTRGTLPVQADTRLDRRTVEHHGDGTVRMELILRGERRPGRLERVPTDVVVVLDKSGSMDGDKIAFARDATMALVDLLGPGDRFGLVTYDDDARFVVQPEPASPAAAARWRAAIGDVRARGSTNMSGGLDLALSRLAASRMPGRAARVILISDGLPNRGDSSFDGLVSRGFQAARSEFVLTSVGVGADFNEHLMASLADAGTGNYYYLQNGNSLGEVFAEEFTSASATVASGLGVDVTLPPGVELIDAGGFPIERDGRNARFQIGALFGGQERSIWLTFRVPTDAVRAVEIPALGLGWTDGDQRLSLAVRAEAPVDCVEGKAAALAGIDKDAWEQSVVQEEWGALRQEVARDVQEGRKDAAKEKVEAYRSRLGEANGYVQSAAVSKNLDDAAALQDEVDAAFAAPDAAAQRNELSKKASSEAWSERKVSRKK